MVAEKSVRPIPLKIAGVIGLFAAAYYLAVAVGEDEGIGPALFWLVLMGGAAALAWFADQFEGRRAAMVAAGMFFVLGVLSPMFFGLVFLAAVLLCVAGFVRLPTR